MVTLLAVSDWRTQPIEDIYTILREVDPTPNYLLYAGDDLARFKDSESGTDHLAELARLTQNQLTLFVRGNDDITPDMGVRFDSKYTRDLHRQPYSSEKFRFIGQEGSVTGPGLITYSEEEVERHLTTQHSSTGDNIPILVSHSPPHGMLDIGRRFGQRHTGSTAVRDFIEEGEIPLTVCGHCHQYGGKAEELEFGTVINIASHDGPNDPGKYTLITLETSEEDLTCEYEFYDTRHLLGSRLTDLVQVGRNRVEHFDELGIESPEDITEDRREELEALPGSSTWHVDRWLAHRRAFEKEEVIVLNPQEFDYVRYSDPILLDIETDLEQSRIWLVGTYSYADDSFTQFFEPDDEKSLLEDLLGYLEDHCRCPIVYYGGNNFDEVCLDQRFEAHGLDEGTIHLERAYDLGIIIQQEFFGPFSKYDLTTVAKSLGYEYEDPSIDGFEVGSEFTKYLLDDIEPNWDRLKQYNFDDIGALKSITDFIRN